MINFKFHPFKNEMDTIGLSHSTKYLYVIYIYGPITTQNVYFEYYYKNRNRYITL
jgi:hypothetical protein